MWQQTFSAIVLLIFTFSQAEAQSQRIENPRLGSYFVDRCLNFGQNCDRPAADAYCRSRGFDVAIDFQWIERGPTWVQGDAAVCDKPNVCGSFTYVVCGQSSAPKGQITSVLLNRAVPVERCSELVKALAPGRGMTHSFTDANAQVVAAEGDGLIIHFRCASQARVVVIYGVGRTHDELVAALGWWYQRLDKATAP